MWDLIRSLLIGALAIVATGAALVGYVLWRRRRRMDDALQEAAGEAEQQAAAGGGGGPTKPVPPK
jgi:uncharacterized iron-regulated membrane protein